MMKLHCFGESGNAYKAALTLTLAKLEWDPVFVDFFKGATRTPEPVPSLHMPNTRPASSNCCPRTVVTR